MSEIALADGGQSSGAERATRRWARLLRLLTGQQALGWVDQIAVSAMGFLTLVLIGAWSGIGELGIYAVCMSLLALALASQESLVTRPFTIQMHDSRDAAGHAFGALAASLILGFGAALLLAAVAGVLTLGGGSPQAASAAWALAGSLPFVLLRDFARRLAFARMQTGQALVLDLAVVAINAMLLAGLVWSGHLSAPAAVAAVGLSCAAGAAAWLWLTRGGFAFGLHHLRATARRSWGMGRWLFSAQMAMQVQGYTTHWLSMALAGAAATGAYAACTSMVAFANPLLFGFFNIMIPKSARVFSVNGGSGLRRQALRDALLLAAMMSVFCAFLALWGESAMALLFPDVRGYGTVLTLLGLASMAAAVGAPASTALASASRARAVAGVTAVAAVLNFGLVWWLLGAYGLTGAAVGILAAEVLGSIGRWGAFLALVPDPARPVNQDHKGAPAMPPTARAARAADAAPGIVDDGAGHMLRSVVDLLDRQGIAYCIPHGYAAYPDRIGSDVDCIVDPRVSARRIQTLLQRKGPGFGALVVRCRGRHIVLAGRNSDGSRCYLTLDIDVDSGFGGVTFFTGEEMLADRRRFGAFCIPAPAKEFGAYIARCVARERLDADRTGRLEALFRQDPPGCRNQLHGLWAQGAADLILDALASSDWAAVAAHLPVLRRQLHTRSAKRFPIRSMLAKLQRVTARAARLLRPDGLSVVVLGPDGAGKSSTTEAIGGADLVPAFDRSVCQGFVPPLHRLIGRNHGPSKEPHALPSRSLPHSMLRWAYWLGYSYADQLRVHLAIARGTLVLYDRHLVDVLVDQKRYRYSGPMWPMRLLWTLVPKPDLVVVLDAPAEVIQARKQEVPFAETARQRDAYLTLVRSLGYGYAIDASRPFDQVTGQLNDIILKVLEARIARRLGRRASGVGNRCAAILAAPPASR